MWFEKFFWTPRKNKPIRNRSKRAKSPRPLVEPLESRDLMAVFSPGDLIILQAGDNSAGQTTGALFLNEIHTDGTTTGIPADNLNVAIPNNQVVGGAGNQPITIDLSAAAGNGQLNRSYDGSVLSFAGLDANTGDAVVGSNAAATGTADRVIAVAGNDPAAAGFLDTATHGQFYVGDDARGAILASPTGPIYAVGHPNQAGGAVSQGVHFFPSTGPSIGTQVSASGNIRGATIGFDSRAYFSTAAIAQPVNTGGIFTEAQALPTAANANPAADIQVVPSLFSASKLGGIFLADMNGNGILGNGDRLYFLDDGTVGGAGSGGLYVATWDDTNTANPWNTPNNAAALAAGLTNHWSIPVRLGDAPVQDAGVGNLRGLTGTVISSTEVDLYTTAFDNVAGNTSYVQQWVDTNTGVGVANAQVLSGTTVQITTLIPLPASYTTGTMVQVDGVGATTGAGALNMGYNGAWSITVTGTNTFTYNDTNSGASGLGQVNNQGGADVTITPTTILTQANGSVTIGANAHAAIGLRGVAFAPVAATSVILDVNGSSSVTVSPGTNVTFNATLSNTQVGTAGLAGLTVTFIDQNTNTVIGSGIVGAVTDGVASFTTTTSLVGNHTVQAYFAGGGTNALASARSGSVLVFEAGYSDSLTAVSANLSNAAIGRSVTLTATVTSAGAPTPRGTVSFYVGGGSISSLLGTSVMAGGVATLTTSFNTAGTQTITAIYNGDDTYESSQNTTVLTVAANATATLTSSANNVPLGSTQTYTVTINGNATLGTPNGTVVFHLVSATNLGVNGAPSVVANSSAITLTAGPNNTATAPWTGPALGAPGSYFITVSYTPTPAPTTPYVAFATDTLSERTGLAFIETVKQAFTPGNLIAVQRGDGNINLGSNAYLTFLDEYTQGGALVQKIAMPNADSGATHALFLSGQNPAEGLLNRSADGNYLTLAGYDTPVGKTFITSTFPYQFPRTIALVDGSANVDTSTAIGVLNSTGVAAVISGATASSTSVGATVTITTSSAHNFKVGQQILISGITTAGYNGSVVITAVPTGTTFTYTDALAPAATTAVLGSTPAATPSSVPFNPVDVVTYDGKEFWLLSTLNTGNVTESGILYVGRLNVLGATTALDIGPAGKDGRGIAIAGGKLYVSQGDNIQSVGSNLPTSAGQTLTNLPNLQSAYDSAFPSPQPQLAAGFLFLNTTDGTSNNPNVVYIADQANGLLKFYKDNLGNWQYGASGTGSHAQGTFGQKLLFSGGVTGVVGYVQNPGASADVQLYVTGVNIQGQNANQIAFFDDMGPFDNGFTNSGTGNFATKALVGATGSPASPNGNENFAGLAFAPGYLTATTLSDSGSGTSYTFTAHVSSSSTNTPTGVVLFYLDGVLQTQTASWTLDGSGNATYTNAAFPAGTHTVTAVYQGDLLDGASTGTLTQGSAAFTAGDLIATLVGTGSALTGNGTATFINEFSTSGGAAVQSISLPTTGVSAFTEKGTSANEGFLANSADGHRASLAGYNVAAGTSTGFTNSPVAIVNPNGSIESSTLISSGDTGGSVRAVASADGLGFWVATSNYVRYVPFGNTSLTGTSAVTNYLQSPTTVEIGNGNLYFTGGAGAQSNGVGAIDGPVQIGSGLPDVGGQTATILAGFPLSNTPNGFPNSNQFAISPDGNTIFVADGRTNAGGGILEFNQAIPGSWINVNSGGAGFPIGSPGPDSGLLGLSVDWSAPSAPVIYAITSAASGNRIVKITGGTTDGTTPSYVVTTLETAAANTAFRGVAFAPKAAGAVSGSTTTLTVSGSPGSYPGGVTLSVSVTGADSGTPTGYVSFRLPSGKEIGSALLVSGAATLTPASDLQVSYTGMITAVYTGDAHYSTSMDTKSATITKDTTTTALAAQFTSVATGVSDTLTAQVTYAGGPNGMPTGTVTFWQDAVTTGINLGTFPLTQTIVNVGSVPTIEYLASTSTTFSTTGVKHMFAVYSGDSNFMGGQGTQDVTVVLPSTTTVTTSNANPTASGTSVTLTATVTGTGATPTGTVAFYDDSLLIAANVALNGSGVATTTLTTSLFQQIGITLLPGLQSITAVYSGDSTYFQSIGVYEQAVQAQAFGVGDQFVYRVGDGTTSLIAPAGNPNAGTAAIGGTIYIDEINPAGTDGSNVVQSIILPSADGQGSQASIHAIVGNGQQSTTGQLTVDGAGSALWVTGYDNNPLNGAKSDGTGIGTTAAAIPTATTSVNTSVARIALNGTVQDVAMTRSNSGSNFGNFNAVYSPDGSQYYVGGNGGVSYFASFSPSAGLQTPTAKMTSPGGTGTALEPFGSNLAVVEASGAGFGSGPIDAYSGFPITPASITQPAGFNDTNALAGGQASNFYIDAYFTHLDNSGGTAPAGINTAYISDDGPSFAHGAITKWALVAGTWTVVDHITAGTGNNAISFYYLSGSTALDGPAGTLGNVTLYATYGNGGNSNTGPGELYKIVDNDGYNAVIGTGGTHSDAAPRVANVSATSKETYRGVAAFPVSDLTGSGTPVTGTENVSTGSVQVATFTDPLDPGQVAAEALGNFTVTVDWGDGTALDTTATLSVDSDNVTYHVNGTHTYAEDSVTNYPIIVTIKETGMPGRLVVNTTATIAAATVGQFDLTAGVGVPVSAAQAEENVAFTAAVATFTDPVSFGGTAHPVTDFQAIIDWGDGTTPSTGTITITNAATGAYIVAGTHTYAEATVTPYQITVTITEVSATSGQLVVHTTAAVREGFVGDFDITGAGVPIAATATTEFTGTVATFTDPVNFGGTADTVLGFQATIDWGDGTATSVGTMAILDASLGTYSVTGTHTYADAGTFTVKVTITEAGTSGDLATSTATVDPAPAPSPFSGPGDLLPAGLRRHRRG